MAGGKWRGGFLPLVVLLVGALVSGMLVAWRRLDTTASPQRDSPGPLRQPQFYEPQAAEETASVRDEPRGGVERLPYAVDEEAAEAAVAGPSKTLVIYVYHESDRVTRENLEFFLTVAVGEAADPEVDYVIAVNGPASVGLEGLPPNVRVVRRANVCYDGGTAGEVLAGMDVRPYRFFIIMNSSVRGPFLPAYFATSAGGGIDADADADAGIGIDIGTREGQDAGASQGQGQKRQERRSRRRRRPWTTALTDLLNERVKLAGTTISCEIRVHVQSMVLATDRVGLEVLWRAGTLDCARDRDDAILRYELGASAQILGKGYGVDCLMLRYRGVDWLAQDRAKAMCNEGRNPFVALNNDGLDTNPLEVLFVKVKPHTLASDHALQRWTDYALGRDAPKNTGARGGVASSTSSSSSSSSSSLAGLASTHFASPAVQRLLEGRRQRLERAVADCRASFDHAGFAALYPDLARGGPEATYAEFLERHLWSGHAFRYAVPETRADQLPFPYCQPFLRYGAPDLSG